MYKCKRNTYSRKEFNIYHKDSQYILYDSKLIITINWKQIVIIVFLFYKTGKNKTNYLYLV